MRIYREYVNKNCAISRWSIKMNKKKKLKKSFLSHVNFVGLVIAIFVDYIYKRTRFTFCCLYIHSAFIRCHMHLLKSFFTQMLNSQSNHFII